ncbi:phage capsid protein [Mycobacteroides abscessus subsp. massiliense]|uniref:phage major capsid protein n=1 Tax=Mycobacteroides abscessus TaxID=36809 RepID=UPI0009A734AF|nr:phage major capsid protein [Mycobacteroides abscessus]SKK75361.1 phage capsid protein [Mycobacteroides abscessus subsp. massiliense]SKL00837.1 phage capsid protein [Mycobacteroides abscessus subsp. massiliense]SKM11311.1 phage capsid protein [Mycobacteroides abscessus subsp. massiliense]
MAVTNAVLQQAWTPEQYGTLIDTVIAAKSIAFQASTVTQTANEKIRFPMLTADPAVGWYAENTSIALTDPNTNELIVVPSKVAGRTQISNEAAQDTTPGVAEQTGTSLARSIAKKIDAAFFANTTVNGPNGLLSLAGINTVDTSAVPLTSLDAFHEAKYAALADGANLTHFILAPDVALALSKAKQATGWNTGLLDNVGDGITLAGVPVLVSVDVAAGNAWGVDASQIFLAQRTGTTVVMSQDAAFDMDAVQVRATARVSWGFANPAGVVRIYDAP